MQDHLMQFFNRTDELVLLRDRVSGSSAESLTVYGRRCVGKTELLSHLANGEIDRRA
jgi:AAA+ ATPase superfamily predicted ATPase